MTIIFNKSQIDKIVSFAIEAGDIANKAFKTKDFEIKIKSDNSKVTSADIEISKFIDKKLTQEFPQIPVICEEGDLRKFDEDVFWLIDPIDGTSSFIAGSDQFAINIALIKNKKAVFGLIYAPAFEGGKMVFSNYENQVIFFDGINKKILETKKPDQNKLRIVTSPRTKDSEIDSFIAEFYKDSNKEIIVERLSSAVKFFRLLEGQADIYLHLRESMEWDIASGQALLEIMNGKVKNLLFNNDKIEIGETISYKKDNFCNQFFIATLW